MPDGYRRGVLPSPWRGAGAGLGSILAGLLMKPMLEREAQEEQVREAYEQAQLTGDPKALAKLREQYPKAIERFEQERGLELPPMPTPEVPEKRVELPRAPGARMPGAAVTLPGKPEAPEIPWPTTPTGMQVRDIRERAAGRPGLPRPPGAAMSDAVQTVMRLPEEQRQEGWDFLRKTDPTLPEIKFRIPEREPVTVSETAAVEAIWDLTGAERAEWHERKRVPRRAPDEPEPERPRPLSVAQLA